MKTGITSKTNTILALRFKRLDMVHTNKIVEKILSCLYVFCVRSALGSQITFYTYLITPIFLIEHLNAGVPRDPVNQYPRFQLSAVYRGPKKKLNK
jgi:hypothetical protein